MVFETFVKSPLAPFFAFVFTVIVASTLLSSTSKVSKSPLVSPFRSVSSELSYSTTNKKVLVSLCYNQFESKSFKIRLCMSTILSEDIKGYVLLL